MTTRLGGSSKINKHGQVILPSEVKKILNVNMGDNVGFWIDDETNTVQIFTTKK